MAEPAQDWTSEVAERIESAVGAVRDRTAVPATKLARAVVFGSVAGVLGSLALLLAALALFRLVNVYLPFHPRAARVWATYLIFGAIFLLLGALLWHKRFPKRRGR